MESTGNGTNKVKQKSFNRETNQQRPHRRKHFNLPPTPKGGECQKPGFLNRNPSRAWATQSHQAEKVGNPAKAQCSRPPGPLPRKPPKMTKAVNSPRLLYTQGSRKKKEAPRLSSRLRAALPARQLSSPGPRASRPRPLPTPAPRKRRAGPRSRRPRSGPGITHRARAPPPAPTTDSAGGLGMQSVLRPRRALPSSSSRSRRGPEPRSPLQLARLLAEGSGLVVAGTDEQCHAALPARGPSLSAPAVCPGLRPALATAVSSLACPAHSEGRDWKAPTVRHSLSPGGAAPSPSHPGPLLPAAEVPGCPRRPPPSPVPARLPAWPFARLLWPARVSSASLSVQPPGSLHCLRLRFCSSRFL